MGKKTVLLSAVFAGGVLLSACGGGGSGSSSPISLYFTDDASMYPVVNVTVYEVSLCSDPACQNKVQLFQNTNGLTVDLTNLNGVLQYIDTTTIPEGSYPRLEVVLSQQANICDNNGQCHDAVFTEMDEKPTKPNVVNCPPGYTDSNGNQLCYIRYNGVINPTAMEKLILDFNLKDFEVNTTTTPWQITEVKVSPLTPSEANASEYKIHAVVQSVDTGSLTVSWKDSTYTVNVTDSTRCEVMDTNYWGQDCLNQIQPSMCVEIKSQEDPSTTDTLTAVEIEAKSSEKCGEVASGGNYEGMHTEVKGSVSNIDTTSGTFDVSGTDGTTVTVTVTSNTYCEYGDVHYKGSACLTGLQDGWNVEVKLNQNKEAIKIEKAS